MRVRLTKLGKTWWSDLDLKGETEAEKAPSSCSRSQNQFLGKLVRDWTQRLLVGRIAMIPDTFGPS